MMQDSTQGAQDIEASMVNKADVADSTSAGSSTGSKATSTTDDAHTGVLFISTGSPVEPTAEATRDYLEAYLTDRRLVDIPRAQWYPILYGIILRKRPPRTAERYAKIWTNEGSPLMVYTEQQRVGLQARLERDGHHIPVMTVYRYAEPTIEDGVRELVEKHGVRNLIVVTCYPQYASVTNGTMYQELFSALSKLKRIPSVSTVGSYHDNPKYLDALAKSISQSWTYTDDGRHALIFTYHSTLCADIEAGDDYEKQTHQTAALVAQRLGIPEKDLYVGYQSVFDKGRPWLGPQTHSELLPQLARDGYTDVAVIAPGFTADCLETHYDVNTDQRHTFEELVPQGRFTYVHCLNGDPAYIEVLGDLVEERL